MKTANAITIAALTGLLVSAITAPVQAQVSNTLSKFTASVTSKLHVAQVKPMQFRVSYPTPQSKHVSLRILDIDKNILFSESKRLETHYLKHFDLSTLIDGTYTFELTDGKEKFSQSFDVSTKTSRVVSFLK
jgi:hypothetical protein